MQGVQPHSVALRLDAACWGVEFALWLPALSPDVDLAYARAVGVRRAAGGGRV